MKTYIAVGAIIVLILAGILFFIFGTPHTVEPTPIETRNCSGLLDRNDVEICEGDKLTDSSDDAKINTVKYGTYKDEENKFYIMGQDGIPGPLNDLGDVPKEQRSVIVK